MKKFILAILAIFALLVGTLLFASTQPDHLHVERTLSINTAPERIFPLINDFYLWEVWTPYNKDPEMKGLFSGSPNGVGASYEWAGNREVGKGEVSIIDSVSPNKVVLDLHMLKPFDARSTVAFTLAATGATTQVTWSMDCKQTLLTKVMGVLHLMDYMVGKDFEVGLSRLKTIAEK